MAKSNPTQDQVDDILTSDESNGVVGKRLGIHHKTVEKVRRKHVHSVDDTSMTDGPKTPENDACEPETASQSINVSIDAPRMAEDYPTTVYTDGPDNIVQTLACHDGIIPAGWHDNATDCVNYNGCDDTTRFEAFD